jgi:hypothetical protein
MVRRVPVRVRLGVVDASMVRANLLVSGQVEVSDPTGRVWTVQVVRPDEPRSPWVLYSSYYAVVLWFRQLARLVRRDTRWNVEVLPGGIDTDSRKAIVHVTAPTRDDAMAEAARLAESLQAGTRLQGF